MKKTIFILLVFFSFKSLQAQSSTVLPDRACFNCETDQNTSAVVEIQSTSKGILIPRMTTSQITNISNPAKGLLVFNTTNNSFRFYDGSSWKELGAGTSGSSIWTNTSNAIENPIGSTVVVNNDMHLNGDLLITGGDNSNLRIGSSVTTPLSENSFNNTFIGSSGLFLSNGSDNTMIGYEAGVIDAGDGNTILGSWAMRNFNATSSYNTAIGVKAGNGGHTQENVFLGAFTGNGFSTDDQGNFIDGSNNVMIGYEAGTFNGGSGNVFLGNKAGFWEEGNDKLYITNKEDETPLIFGDFIADLIRINGNLDVTGDFTINGQTAGSGGTNWDLSGTDIINNNGGDVKIKSNLQLFKNAVTSSNSLLGAIDFRGSGQGPFVSNKQVALIECRSESDFSTPTRVSGSLRFFTSLLGGSTEKMRITSDGRVGIGTTTPGKKLHVNGDALFEEEVGFKGLTGFAGGAIFRGLAPVIFDSDLALTKEFFNIKSIGDIKITIDSDSSSTDNSFIINGSGITNLFEVKETSIALHKSTTINSDLTLTGELNLGDGVNSDIIPTDDETYNIGSPDDRWNEVFAVNGIINTSDGRLKRNIKELPYGLQEILKLRPVSYKWKNDKLGDETRLGFIAQEINEILKEVVRTKNYEVVDEKTGARAWKENKNWGIAYSEIIPVLVTGIQEQQVQIQERDDLIEHLESEVNELQTEFKELQKIVQSLVKTKKESIQTTTLESAKLGQNMPNPFDNSTKIPYAIPTTSSKATITVHGINGQLIKTIPIQNFGEGVIELQTIGFGKGQYTYTLEVDGRVVDTKKMNLVK